MLKGPEAKQLADILLAAQHEEKAISCNILSETVKFSKYLDYCRWVDKFIPQVIDRYFDLEWVTYYARLCLVY